MNDDYKIMRLKSEINESCDKFYKNHKRIADYIIVNNFTFQLMLDRLKGISGNEFDVYYYQGYRLAIDNSLKDYEFKIVGD